MSKWIQSLHSLSRLLWPAPHRGPACTTKAIDAFRSFSRAWKQSRERWSISSIGRTLDTWRHSDTIMRWREGYSEWHTVHWARPVSMFRTVWRRFHRAICEKFEAKNDLIISERKTEDPRPIQEWTEHHSLTIFKPNENEADKSFHQFRADNGRGRDIRFDLFGARVTQQKYHTRRLENQSNQTHPFEVVIFRSLEKH